MNRLRSNLAQVAEAFLWRIKGVNMLRRLPSLPGILAGSGLLLALVACGGSSTSSKLSLPQAEASPTAAASVAAPSTTAIVDDYATQKTNGNPCVAVLSPFSKLYTAGSAWNNGTILNASVMAANNQYVVDVTKARTQAQEVLAYQDDRRDQTYDVMDGLGPLTSLYIAGAGASTTIPAWDTSTYTTEYDDAGSGDPGGSYTSALGKVVALVNNLRSVSTTPAKKAYNYPRPWRLNTSGVVDDTGSTTAPLVVTVINGSSTSTSSRTWNIYNSQVSVAPSLLVVRSTTPASDYGFPSGHTNAGYLAAYALAYAVPERYQEMLTRASELGENRILAGQHSPLDVMGGRMMATAWAAAILYNNDMSNTSALSISKGDAYTAAHSYFYAQTGTTSTTLYDYAHSANTTVDPYADWATNRANYKARLTYGFSPIADTSAAPWVPKGAEVLLETRLPYLDATQRRWVLYTTSLPSGYPLLDDAEGWGRLNLFSAADGYGAFHGNVIVNMDATKGGFSASDTWRNDISGSGKLFKQGTGTLKLAGHNSYTGGTQVDGGTLEADTLDALGQGNVVLNGGTLLAKASGRLVVTGSYNQLSGALELDWAGDGAGLLNITEAAGFGGTLNLKVLSGFTPVSGGTYDLILTGGGNTGRFSTINVTGTSLSYRISYDNAGVHLTFN